jgi:hypothetical protein
MAGILRAERRYVPPFLRLLQRDRPPPLVLTLRDERGNEIERATAATGSCALKAALWLLAKRDALRPGDVLRIEAGD